jgi:hypothetical protein
VKPFYFILPAIIVLVVAVADLANRGTLDFLLKGKADAAEKEVTEELAALQKVDFDSKLKELNRTRQLQGLPTYNVR